MQIVNARAAMSICIAQLVCYCAAEPHTQKTFFLVSYIKFFVVFYVTFQVSLLGDHNQVL